MGSSNMASVVVSRSVLELAPPRALAFLRTVGRSVSIRQALETAGYSPADHEEGWRLLHKIAGYREAATEGADTDNAIDEAHASVEAWAIPALARAQLALAHRHPEHHAFVFDGLAVERGAGTRTASRRRATPTRTRRPSASAS